MTSHRSIASRHWYNGLIDNFICLLTCSPICSACSPFGFMLTAIFLLECFLWLKCSLIATDPRTQDSFLLNTPEPMLAIVLAYLAFVVIAPRVMENRPPMDLKKFIIVYNFMLVVLSGYMCLEVYCTFLTFIIFVMALSFLLCIMYSVFNN